MSHLPQVIVDDIYNSRDQFEAALVDPRLKFDGEAGFALQILQGNDYTAKVAKANGQSLVDAVVNVAAIGLSLNPALKLAYLVPRDGKIKLDISYAGLLHLAVDGGGVTWAQARIVREGDAFELREIGQAPLHRYDPFGARGEIRGAYVVARVASTGDYLVDHMNVAEINGIRDRSESWKKGGKGPWRTDWEQMALKTVIKRGSKLWPKAGRLDSAVHYLNTAGGEGLAPAGIDADTFIARIHRAQTEAEVFSIHAEAMAAAAPLKDREGAQRVKDAGLERRDALRRRDEERTVDMPG